MPERFRAWVRWRRLRPTPGDFIAVDGTYDREAFRAALRRWRQRRLYQRARMTREEHSRLLGIYRGL